MGHSLPDAILWDDSIPFAQLDLPNPEYISSIPILFLGDIHPEDIQKLQPDLSFHIIKKPFYFYEAVQILLRLILTQEKAYDEAISLGQNLLFNPKLRTLERKDNHQISELTDKEVLILQHLFRKNRYGGQGITPREELLARIWGYQPDITTHTLETHIYRLRQKLESLHPEGNPILLNQEGGYLLQPAWN